MGYNGGKLPETDEDHVLDLACSYHEYLGVPRHLKEAVISRSGNR